MKKLAVILLSFLLAAALLSGCVTYNPATKDPSQSGPSDTDPSDKDPSAEEPFTVTVVYEGRPFYPDGSVMARWTAMDGSNFTMDAPFDGDGVAMATGLDGDYYVTLTSLPQGYIYDPNSYTATNYRRNVEIRLIKLLNALGSGTDWYGNVVRLTQTGAYGVTFTEPYQEICCQFYAPESGKFIIESIMDITANEINPRIDIYGNNASWHPDEPYESVNTGGVSSIYTKNFRYEYDNAQGAKGVIAFKLKCDSRIEFPVTLYFIIDPNGASSATDSVSMYIPYGAADENGNPRKSPEKPAGTSYINFGLDDDGGLLDGTRVYYEPSDGYYHVYNRDGSKSDTVLYFGLTSPIIDFTDTENMSYRIYNVKVKDENGNYVMTSDGKNVTASYNYLFFLLGYNGVLEAVNGELEDSLPEDLKNHEALADKVSYNDCMNSDGKIAVTEEVREFLQNYCSGRYYFFDGNGSAERPENPDVGGYKSSDENQWLVCCGYYA